MRESPMRPSTPPRRLGQPANDSGANQGNFILKKGVGELWKPAFDGSPTTIRVFPGLSPDDPTQFDPWRFSTADDALGQWYYPISCIQNIGNPGKSWVLYDPQDAAYDPQTNPVWMLYNAIDRAVRDRTDRAGWAGMMKGGAGRGALLDRPKDCVLLQAAIMAYKNKLYAPPRGGGAPGTDNTVFFLLTPSARKSMNEAMNTRIEGYRGDPDNIPGHYVHGDPIGLDGGQYVTFYKLGFDPREQMRNRQAATTSFGQAAKGSGGGRQSDDDPIGYGCFLSGEFNGMPARLREVEGMVRAHVKPFWDSVRVEPESIQVRWLEEGFKNEADALVYALDEAYGQHLRPEYRERGLAMLGRGRPVTGGWDPNQGGGAPAGNTGFGGAPANGGFGGAPPQGGYGAQTQGGGYGSGSPRPASPYGPAPAPQPQPTVGAWGAPAPQVDDQAGEFAGSEGDQLGSTEEQAAVVFGGQPAPSNFAPSGYAPQQQQVFGQHYGNPPAAAPATGYHQPNPTYPTHPQNPGGFGAPPQQGGFGAPPSQTRPHTPDVPQPGAGIPDHTPHVSAAPVPPSTGGPVQGQPNEVQAALERARAKAAQKKTAPPQGNQPR